MRILLKRINGLRMNSVKNADDDLKVDTGGIVETIAKDICLRKVRQVGEIFVIVGGIDTVYV